MSEAQEAVSLIYEALVDIRKEQRQIRQVLENLAGDLSGIRTAAVENINTLFQRVDALDSGVIRLGERIRMLEAARGG